MIRIKRIEKVPITKLKENEKNAKMHDIDAIVESIEKFGYVTPIVVDETYRVIAGHGRLKALKKLGVDEVVVVVTDLTDDEIEKYMIYDNRLTEIGGWDVKKLKEMIGKFNFNEFRTLKLNELGLRYDFAKNDENITVIRSTSEKKDRIRISESKIVVGFGRFTAFIDADKVYEIIEMAKRKWKTDETNVVGILVDWIYEKLKEEVSDGDEK